jgi:hypothetical protein
MVWRDSTAQAAPPAKRAEGDTNPEGGTIDPEAHRAKGSLGAASSGSEARGGNRCQLRKGPFGSSRLLKDASQAPGLLLSNPNAGAGTPMFCKVSTFDKTCNCRFGEFFRRVGSVVTSALRNAHHGRRPPRTTVVNGFEAIAPRRAQGSARLLWRLPNGMTERSLRRRRSSPQCSPPPAWRRKPTVAVAAKHRARLGPAIFGSS